MRISGIYQIKNLVNGKVYIGSAVHIQKRWRRHRDDLRNGGHHSTKLKRAWNKYGEAQFEFLIVEIVECLEQLISREQFWINSLNSFENGYNSTPLAGSSLGYKATPETKEKIASVRRGSKASDAARANMSAAGLIRMGRPEAKAMIAAVHLGAKRTAETKAKIAAAKTGKKRTAEEKLRMSIAQKARPPASEETRARIAAANLGSKRTEETKTKMSAAQKARMSTPESKAEMSRIHSGKIITPEVRAKIAEKLRGRKLLPETIAKRSATIAAKKLAIIQASLSLSTFPLSSSTE